MYVSDNKKGIVGIAKTSYVAVIVSVVFNLNEILFFNPFFSFAAFAVSVYMPNNISFVYFGSVCVIYSGVLAYAKQINFLLFSIIHASDNDDRVRCVVSDNQVS